MILDRTWNKKEQKLTISYIDKEGNRQFLSKYLRYIKGYEYDKDGEFETWDGKKCRKVFKDTSNYTPNEFEILEHLYELPEDQLKELHAQNFPKVYTYDIETQFSTEFPFPDKAEYEITAISLVGPDLSCIVYGLNSMDDSQIERFRKRYLEWIENNDFAKFINKGNTPKVLYQKFDNEKDMLKHWWTHIVPKVGVLAGWNIYNFDHQYMVNRTINLFGKGMAYSFFKKSSPTNELSKISFENFGNKTTLPAPSHTILIDYMEICKKYDYILRPYDSFSLDWVSEHAFNSHKIKYNGTLQQLYEKDREWYYYYNAIDSLLVQLIHYKLRSFESPCAVSSVTLVPVLKAFGQVALTTANIFKEFYDDNKKVVYDYDSIERVKIPYEGAFCGCATLHESGKYGHAIENETEKREFYIDESTGELKERTISLGKAKHIGLWCSFNVCEDFASLYPSQIITCNFSFENILTKTVPNNIKGLPDVKIPWTEEELNEFRKDKNYFVSIQGNVYKNDRDYAFKRMQKRTKANRNVYKYLAQKIDAQLLTEIDNLIKQKSESN